MSETTPLKADSPPPHRRPLWRSYFELMRLQEFPDATMMLFWPCALGLAFGAQAVGMSFRELIKYMALYFIGGAFIGGAAVVLNDICDRKLDRLVERTKNRPLAAGDVSVASAVAIVLMQTGSFLGMLSLTNPLAFKVGLFGVFPLHALYPLMKRWTNWPQAWLGLAMNWGLPVAYIGVTGKVHWELLTVTFLGSWSWTMVYDTIYGCQDMKDDIKAGIKSTALLFGSQVKLILTGFAVTTVSCLAYAGYITGQPAIYYGITVGGVAAHLTWQLGTLDVNDPDDCMRKFMSNSKIGYLMLGGLLAQYL